jgi:hypothetical protein
MKPWCGYQLATETRRLYHLSEEYWKKGWGCVGGMQVKRLGTHCHGNHVSAGTFYMYFFNFFTMEVQDSVNEDLYSWDRLCRHLNTCEHGKLTVFLNITYTKHM